MEMKSNQYVLFHAFEFERKIVVVKEWKIYLMNYEDGQEILVFFLRLHIMM